MADNLGPLAIVTGASSGIGLELAKCCAQNGYDLIIAADEAAIHSAAQTIKTLGVDVEPVEADLSTEAGVQKLYERVKATGRQVEVLCANAGRGLGQGFLDQDFKEAKRVIDSNVTGTINLVQKIARDMRARGNGHVLIVGSIAGFMPGTFQAVYNGTKAFLDSFSFALRAELEGTGVTVTCLMPGATDTEFFVRADMLDSKVGAAKKDDPADVARIGFDAMMRGEGDVVSGWKNKLISALALITPSPMLAEQHRKMAKPGTAQK